MAHGIPPGGAAPPASPGSPSNDTDYDTDDYGGNSMQELISENQVVRKHYADSTKKIGKLENDLKAAEAAIQASDQEVRKLYADTTKIGKLENDLKASDRQADQARAKTEHAIARMIGMYSLLFRIVCFVFALTRDCLLFINGAKGGSLPHRGQSPACPPQ
jgi:hypothetical protein